MDSAWLEDFLALVDGGHFSRAAEQRGITQPAFSRRVRALEEWVGSPLFDRDSQPVSLTPAGIRFRPVAEETLRRLYQGREAAREAGRSAAETLRFAATQALSLTFFPPWLRTLETRAALSATIHLTAAHMVACEGMMLRGEAQFLLCHHHPAAASLLASEPFRGVTVGQDRLLAVSAPRAGEEGVRRKEPLFSLLGASGATVPLLAFSGESGLGRILAASRAGEADAAHLSPSFTSHVASVLVALAREGRGLAFAPMSLVAEDLARGTLVRAADPERDIEIEIRLYRPRARQSPPAERLWAAVAGGPSDGEG